MLSSHHSCRTQNHHPVYPCVGTDNGYTNKQRVGIVHSLSIFIIPLSAQAAFTTQHLSIAIPSLILDFHRPTLTPLDITTSKPIISHTHPSPPPLNFSSSTSLPQPHPPPIHRTLAHNLALNLALKLTFQLSNILPWIVPNKTNTKINLANHPPHSLTTPISIIRPNPQPPHSHKRKHVPSKQPSNHLR